MRKRIYIPGLVLILAALVLNVVGLPIKAQSSPNVVVSVKPLQPYFAEQEKRLGLTGEGKRLYELSAPECVPNLPNGERGLYTPRYMGKPGHIQITSDFCGRFDGEATAALAHEYLHAVWDTHVSDQPWIVADTTAFYNSYSDRVAVRFKFYRDQHLSQGQINNEYHSVFGTEITPSELSPRLQDWYNHWLPNRTILPNLCC